MGEANGVERANEALQDALDKAPKSNLSEEMSQKILNQTKGYVYSTMDRADEDATNIYFGD
ncbi:hypothetical protein OGZ37_13165 [Lactococcus lactis]|uniref:hypothetical protein n=1 Tax=Lactococcus lactis TaxID=1358 RepID=UPI002418B64A|nr:hypothetical protein [Lactococcus lactis]MDG4967504.1 hypothetical protein [Lactococcus lactis]